jgi:hypothetical protein
VSGDDGMPVEELEVVVISRGSMASRQFKHLLATDPVRIDLQTKGGWETWQASLHAANAASSGGGESAVHRFDLVFRETPESAARRAAEHAHDPVEPEPPPVSKAKPRADEDLPEDISEITVRSDSSVWATALKQMQTPHGRIAPPEPPLTPTELAGIEAVLTNLRLDAVIDLLEASGRIRRSDVETRFQRLVKKRFVSEAAPVVGEKAAKRAERDLLG